MRSRFAVVAAGAALGIVAQASLGASPALASLTGPGVSAGKNITVFHNIDFVGAFGYGPAGETIRVDVVRAGVTIGTATGPSVETEEGPGLEVNHGPEGSPQPGDCWTGTTPDIRPGDRIIVTSGDTRDEVTVDDIRFTGPPAEDPATGDVVVRGIARRADGTTIPASMLDSGEFRNATGKYRATPDVVEATAGVVGGFTARYRAPFPGFRNREGLSEADRKQALLGDGHAIGFGHTEPLSAESMLVDGIADVPGPALGCEASPAAPPPGTPTPGTPTPGTPTPGTPTPGDSTAPTVTARTPAPGTANAGRGVNVTAGFSEAVTGVDGTALVLTGPSGPVPSRVTYDAGRRVATVNPTPQLAAGTVYTVSIGSAVTDTAGNRLSPITWTFTTAGQGPARDTVRPTVGSRSPGSGARQVDRNATISATFSEAVTGTSTTTVVLRSAQGTTVPATVAYNAATRTAVLDPVRALEPRTRYTVALTNGIADPAGNRLDATSWSFTTRA